MAGLAAACSASRPFDRYLASGSVDEALRAFETDSALHRNPGAMHRAAMLYATPGRGPVSQQEARRLFASVYELAPSSRDGRSALVFLMLLDEIEGQRASLTHLQLVLERERDEMEAHIARLRLQRDDARLQVATLARQDSVFASELARLQAALRLREEELQSLREELERLKAIDLRPVQRPPPGGREGNDRR